MDSKKIEALLEKYWNCETSLEEEQEIKNYFRTGEGVEKFAESSTLFQYFEFEKKKQSEIHISDGEIMDLVQNSGSSEKMTVEKNKGTAQYLPWFGPLSKIAAVLVVGISITFFVYREQVKEEAVASILQTDTYEDTQKAYEETKKALALISRQLNAGKKQTMKLAKFNEAEEVVKESIKNQ